MSEFTNQSAEAAKVRKLDDIKLFGGSVLGVAGMGLAFEADSLAIKVIGMTASICGAVTSLRAGCRNIFALEHWETVEARDFNLKHGIE